MKAWRRAALALGLLWALTAAFLVRDRLREIRPLQIESPPLKTDTEPSRRVLAATDWGDLPSWANHDPLPALAAFRRSCAAWARQPPERDVAQGAWAGQIADWLPACAALEAADGPKLARELFEREFRPWKVLDGEQRLGLFTGYYEPLLHGSLRRRPPYTAPLYRPPGDLVTLDLGRFRSDLAGRRIAGRYRGGRFEPFPDRRAIEAGALAGRGLELAWVDDPVDAFFLHIQGSGRVELAEGGVLRLGYAGQNGQPYHAIGRELIDRGALEPAEVSMQSIRRWLTEHPAEAPEILETNPSYVFFRRLEGEGPIGSQGVALTPGRSLAVDRSFLPLGAPLFLEALAPSPDPADPDRTLRRLMVAQDTGGAIRGPVRGDVFWGAGEDAATVAGRMRHRGRLWLLLPRAVQPTPDD